VGTTAVFHPLRQLKEIERFYLSRNQFFRNLTRISRRLAMKIETTTLMLLAVTVVLAGCNSTAHRPIAGVVDFSKDYPVGTRAPDIPFISTDGKQTSFKKVSQSIAIVAFTSTPGEACCKLVPELVALAHRFRNEPITVAQISLPTTKCSHGPGCAEHCNINDARLVSLCDADRMAWKAYGQLKPNTVVLVGENNRIAAIEDLENLDSIANKAQRMAAASETIEDLTSGSEGG
jgi:hypothetical protein